MVLALILMILGATIYALIQLKKAFKLVDFTWKLFWKKNIVPIILNYVIGITLIVAAYYYNPDLDVSFGGYNITGLFFAMCGFLAQPIWKFAADEFNNFKNKGKK